MKRVSKVLVIVAASAALTGIAFADDPPAGGEGGAGDAAGAGAETGDGTSTPTPTPDVAAGTVTKANWPLAGIDRPLGAAKGMIEASPVFNVAYRSTTNPVTMMSTSDTFTGLSLGGRYGVNDKLEVLASYNGITFSPDSEFKGSLAVGGGYSVIMGAAGGKLDVEAKAAFTYDLLGETAAILAGADVRYKLASKAWVGTPINRPGLVLFVKGVDAGPAGTISPIFIDLPLAFGFQATPKLMLQANTKLLRLAINDDAGDSVFVGADFLNLDIDALFALSNKMDVRVNLDLGELKNGAGDTVAVGAGVNIRI